MPFAWICGIQLGAWLFLSPGVEPNSIRLLTRSRLGHRQLLAEIAAGRIADDMRAGEAEMVHQLGDIGDQPFERQRRSAGGTCEAPWPRRSIRTTR